MPHEDTTPGAIVNGKFFYRHGMILALFLLLVGGLALYLSYGTELSGDEHFYHGNGRRWARFVLSWVHLAQMDFGEFTDRVVANGWFLPGMGIVLAPAHLVLGGEATVEFFRGYMIAANLAVVFLIIRGLAKLGVPRGYVWLFLLLSCMIPYYLFYLGALWGDLFAAHLAILLLISLERSLLADNAGTDLGYKQAFALGLMLGAIAMVRPQYVMLAGIALARIGLHFLPDENAASAAPRRSAGRFFTIGAIVLFSFGLVLAPWHLALHKRFGATFMVTSLNMGPLFHDPGFSSAALAEYDTTSKYRAVQMKVMASAEASGRTFREQVAIENTRISAQASEPLSERLKRAMTAFYLSESSFLERFLGIQHDPRKYSGPIGDYLLSVNSLAWRFLLAIGVVAFCLPADPRCGNCLAALTVKGLVVMLSLQPLLGMPHGRYYVGLIPVLALLVALQLRASPLDSWRRYRELSPRMVALLMVQVVFCAYGVANVWMFRFG